MNAKEFNVVRDFIQEVLKSKNPEDFIFDPLHKDHPKQDFPDLAYEIASRIVNRFDFVEWEDIEKQDYWLWQAIMSEIEKFAEEDRDWGQETWTESPYKG